MRGADAYNEALFTPVKLEDFVPASRRPTHRARGRHRTVQQRHAADGRPARAAFGRALQRGRHTPPGAGRSREPAAKSGSYDHGTPEGWRGEPRAIDTHEYKSDPHARLDGKCNAAPALLSYLGHALRDNRHGPVVYVQASTADETADRDVAAQMLVDVLGPGQRVRVGSDKVYETRGFVKACRDPNVTPHMAQNIGRNGGTAIDARTTRHVGYEVSASAGESASNSTLAGTG